MLDYRPKENYYKVYQTPASVNDLFWGSYVGLYSFDLSQGKDNKQIISHVSQDAGTGLNKNKISTINVAAREQLPTFLFSLV